MNDKFKQWLDAFLRDEEGASAIEYALMAVMVAVAIMFMVDDVSVAVVNIFTNIKNELESFGS